jgi:hypothetical protein
MRSRAVIALAIIVCVGVFLTGFSLAAKTAAPTAQVLKSPPKTGVAALSPQPEPPDFPVMSVRQLRGQQAGLARVQVRSPGTLVLPRIAAAQVQRVEPGAGSPAYSEGSGVVLDVLHPHHEATGSALIVRGVFWNERVRQQVLAGSSDTSFSIEIREERQVVANVYFQRLPSAMHTYMLTIGTSAEAARMHVRVGGNFLSPSQLVASPSTSEVRALFSYEAGSHGNELMVLIQVSPVASSDDHVYFHHVQLAQLD